MNSKFITSWHAFKGSILTTREIEGCYIVNVNQVVDTGK